MVSAIGRVSTTLPVAQHRDPIGEPGQLRQAVRDVHDADARRPCSSPIRPKRRSASRSARAAVGSSMIKTRASGPERRARSPRAAARPCGASPPERRGRARRPRGRGAPLARSPALAPVDASPGALRLEAQGHVLGHGEVREQRGLLVDRARSPGDRASSGIGATHHACRPSTRRPAVRRVRPRDDLDQRALARAVLADERVDLALAKAKRDLAEGMNTGERLRDTVDVEDVRHASAILPQKPIWRGRPKRC